MADAMAVGTDAVPRRASRSSRLAACIAAALAVGAALLTPIARTSPAPATAAHPVSVIVRVAPGAERSIEQTLARLGGTVKLRLGIIGGFSATLSSAAVEALRHTPGVASVTSDYRMHAQSANFATSTTTFSPTTDMGSMYNITTLTGARKFWGAGYTGKGIDIAMIDSGVAPVDGLTVAGKVANGPDLSFESQASNLTYLDTFGHGTHMAGVMAGRSNAAVAGSYVNDTTDFLGMAPDSRVVSVKVADAHGATDVSQVIAAIDWVVQHKADSGFNIKVINLSYGTNTTQAYTLDPLAYAAEQAWKKGLVVVASAGNSGYQKGNGAPGLADPAYDPYDIAVGASDPMGTVALTDDKVATFSASGCGLGGCKNPSFVAPGAHVVSLRDPGSLIDQTYGSTGTVTSTLFRGSGTSQAAAVVSGACALILQKYPSAKPDQVKQLLASTSLKLGGFDGAAQGAGEINLAKALVTSLPTATQKFTSSTGTGSLDASRGQGRLAMNGVTLSGNTDIFGAAFSPSAMATLEASATSWSGGTWNGHAWSGSAWSSTTWTGKAWSGVAWSGTAWSGNAWSAVTWSSATWDSLAKAWSGASWSSNNWLSGTWANDAWSDSVWATSTWT